MCVCEKRDTADTHRDPLFPQKKKREKEKERKKFPKKQNKKSGGHSSA
jgi:hypothetical protein